MSFAEDLAQAGLENYERQFTDTFLTTGYPNLDAALSGLYKGGGFASGRIIEIFGPSASGKTVIATYVMAAAQKAGGLAGFHDHERAYKKELGVKMCGLSLDPNKWVYDQPWTFEQSIDRMRKKVLVARGMEFSEADGEYSQKKGAKVHYPLDKPIVWVFDSLHSMVPMSAAGKDAVDRGMHDNMALPKATSDHFPALSVFAEATNTLIIFLNQIRLDLKNTKNPKYPVYKSSGGDAPIYYTSQRLRLTVAMLKTADGTELGQRVTCKVIKNKLYRPNLKVSWDFLYQADGTGAFDNVGGVIDRLVELGKLPATKTHITWKDKKFFRKSLVNHIRDSGEYDELVAMLPINLAASDPAAIQEDGPEEDTAGFAASIEADDA